MYTKQLVCSNSLSSLQDNIRQGQVNVSAKLMHYVSVAKPFFAIFGTPISCYFASAAVTVDSSHMTASSFALWSRFSLPVGDKLGLILYSSGKQAAIPTYFCFHQLLFLS